MTALKTAVLALCCIFFWCSVAHAVTYTLYSINDLATYPDAYLAMQAAEQVVNSNPTFNTHFNLSVVFNSTTAAGGMSSTQLCVRNVRYAYQQGAIGVLGCTYSTDTIAALTQFSDPQQFPMVSPFSTSSALTSATTYPYFLRTIPTRAGNVLTVAALTRLLGGPNRSIAVIYSPVDSALVAITQELWNDAQQFQLTIAANITYTAGNTNWDTQVAAFKASGSTLLYLSMQTPDIGSFVAALSTAGVTYPTYQLFGTEGLSSILAGQVGGQSTAAAAAGIRNALAIYQIADTTSSVFAQLNSTFVALRPFVPAAYLSALPMLPTAQSANAFDSVLAFAYAIRSVLLAGNDPTNGPTLMQALRTQPAFQGAAGSVKFTTANNDGTVLRSFAIGQVQTPGTVSQIGVFAASTGQLDFNTNLLYSLPAAAVIPVPVPVCPVSVDLLIGLVVGLSVGLFLVGLVIGCCCGRRAAASGGGNDTGYVLHNKL